MPNEIMLAKCCDTCKHFDCDSGYNLGICELSRRALELLYDKEMAIPKEKMRTIYTPRTGICDEWAERDGSRARVVRIARVRGQITRRLRIDLIE